ncbi:hypothetical protein ACFO8O_00410 [Hephaestia sp. GCM10023244]|uniref:hypothetical protein n=1 Tax=unclassified Hephaestia TaxID=2631281 RepID=UPI0020775E9C|nr:hypothetical protein [Hephaestia sp. MAHUQ-44]MCM8729429.1 hypothetical protein [Hephaestia sp. MAHUQ-44]
MADPRWVAARIAYEREVRALAGEARRRKTDGESLEVIARDLVTRRNALKQRFRAGDDPAIVALMEQRNRLKYGDPIGPDADWLFRKYGSWEAVIAAACRPARIASS